MSTKLTFLPPNSSLEIMHVLKKCYIENVTDCVNYTNFYTRVYTTV